MFNDTSSRSKKRLQVNPNIMFYFYDVHHFLIELYQNLL